jgi:hypothetical protein
VRQRGDCWRRKEDGKVGDGSPGSREAEGGREEFVIYSWRLNLDTGCMMDSDATDHSLSFGQLRMESNELSPLCI